MIDGHRKGYFGPLTKVLHSPKVWGWNLKMLWSVGAHILDWKCNLRQALVFCSSVMALMPFSPHNGLSGSHGAKWQLLQARSFGGGDKSPKIKRPEHNNKNANDNGLSPKGLIPSHNHIRYLKYSNCRYGISMRNKYFLGSWRFSI